MDKDLVRLKRRQSFADRRLEIWEKTKAKYPEGMTSDNLEQIKKEIQEQEKKDRKRVA